MSTYRSGSGRPSCRQVASIVADHYDDGFPLFRFSDRDRCPDHDESRSHHDDGRRGRDHSRGDGGGGDAVTRDVAHHRRQLSSQD